MARGLEINSLKSCEYLKNLLRNRANPRNSRGPFIRRKNVKAVSVLRSFKTRLRSSLPPAIFLAITYYFGWNAVHGKSGLEAQATQRHELAQAQARYAATDELRKQWATKISDLSAQSIQRDMLEEQARAVLNLADPNDLVIDLPPGKPAQ